MKTKEFKTQEKAQEYRRENGGILVSRNVELPSGKVISTYFVMEKYVPPYPYAT